jgi:anti-sigma28 factor (negative regulator of flagellin synthesis)
MEAPAMDTIVEFGDSELDEDLLLADREAQVLEMSKYKETVKALPEIRQERINELKRQIEAGEYHIDSRKIAEKILDRQIEDGSF